MSDVGRRWLLPTKERASDRPPRTAGGAKSAGTFALHLPPPEPREHGCGCVRGPPGGAWHGSPSGWKQPLPRPGSPQLGAWTHPFNKPARDSYAIRVSRMDRMRGPGTVMCMRAASGCGDARPWALRFCVSQAPVWHLCRWPRNLTLDGQVQVPHPCSRPRAVQPRDSPGGPPGMSGWGEPHPHTLL